MEVPVAAVGGFSAAIHTSFCLCYHRQAGRQTGRSEVISLLVRQDVSTDCFLMVN